MTLCGTGACVVTRIGEPLLGDALSTSEWWGVFYKCWYILEGIRLQRIVLCGIDRFLRILEIYYIIYSFPLHNFQTKPSFSKFRLLSMLKTGLLQFCSLRWGLHS